MPDTYYVDGYNVLHKSSLLRPLALEDFEAARDALIDKVALFCVGSGKRAVIVFDGRGRHQPQNAPPPPGVSGLEIVYSPANLSADAVIERMVYKAGNRLDIVVVSNDRGLREVCRGMGALVMEADNFLATVRETKQGITGAMQKSRKDPAPDRLEDRLDPETIARLKATKEGR